MSTFIEPNNTGILRNWNNTLDKNKNRESYLKEQYNNLLRHLSNDKGSDICITGGNSFIENEILGRLKNISYRDLYIYEIDPDVLNWYKYTDYLEKAKKEYNKQILLRQMDILYDYPPNVCFISNDIQGSPKTSKLASYKNLWFMGTRQIINAFISKKIKEVAWLCNTSVRPQGVQYYLDIFFKIKQFLEQNRIYCSYETRNTSCYGKAMFAFGGVFRTRINLSDQTFRKIEIKLFEKDFHIT